MFLRNVCRARKHVWSHGGNVRPGCVLGLRQQWADLLWRGLQHPVDEVLVHLAGCARDLHELRRPGRGLLLDHASLRDGHDLPEWQLRPVRWAGASVL